MEKKKLEKAQSQSSEGIDKQAQEEDKKQEPEEPKIKYLQISLNEEKELKHKIYMKVYEDFLQLY